MAKARHKQLATGRAHTSPVRKMTKKGSKKGPKSTQKHPQSVFLAENDQKRSKRGQKTISRGPPGKLKKPEKGEKTRKNDPIPFLKGRYAKTP